MNINETFASELINYNNPEIDKCKSSFNINNSNNIYSSSHSNIKSHLNDVITHNQKLVKKNIVNTNLLIEKLQNNCKSQVNFNSEENLLINKFNNRVVKNKSQYSASFNKLLKTDINKEDSNKILPKLIEKTIDSNADIGTGIQSNFEKFISTPISKINNIRKFYIKNYTNTDGNDNRVNINAETVSMSVTNNSNFPINVNYSPMLNKNSNSVSNLGNLCFNDNYQNYNNSNSIISLNLNNSQKKSNFSFKNNILKHKQMSVMKLNSENSEANKKPASSIYSSSINSNSNRNLINMSKLKIDPKAFNPKLQNNIYNSDNHNLEKNNSNSNKILAGDQHMRLQGIAKDKNNNQENSINNKSIFEKPAKNLNESPKGEGIYSSNIPQNKTTELKKGFNSEKRIFDSLHHNKHKTKQHQQKKNYSNDRSIKNQHSNYNSNLKSYAKIHTKNSDSARQTKFNSKNSREATVTINTHKNQETDVFNSSNLSSINNSRASNSNFSFKIANFHVFVKNNKII